MGDGVPFREQLRRFRETAGLTQEELAERAGLSANAVGVLERGERQHPYPHTVRRLAEALALTDGECIRDREMGSSPALVTLISTPLCDNDSLQ